MKKTVKTILIFNNLDSHFYNHLLPIANAAQSAGHKVIILTTITSYQEAIKLCGFKVLNIPINRGSINPFKEFITCIKAIKIILREKPDILHNFTIKPIIYGSVASLFFKKNNLKVINNFLGMGFIFINNNFFYILIRKFLCKVLFGIAVYRNLIFIVQNKDDQKLLEECLSKLKQNIYTQCSVGIDTKNIKPSEPKVEGRVVFALVARMLKDKGIFEYVDAAKILLQKGVNAEFWLVGDIDPQNKSSLNLNELDKINKEGYVKYLGFQNTCEIWKKAHVAVLPSYREGLSRSLLEAGACGRAIITTDAPGGKDLIKDQINGLLVQPRDSKSLAKAMKLLALNNDLRIKLGNQIRKHILKNYDSAIIARQMIKFY